ncbi:MAG: acyl-CoA thioesterase, partial [Planctomycetota bacterium]
MTFAQKLRYRFGDIDDAGIAYYPKLLHCFHCAFEDWWSDALCHPYPRLLHDDKLGFPAVKLEAEFFAPIRYGDDLTVHLAVLR